MLTDQEKRRIISEYVKSRGAEVSIDRIFDEGLDDEFLEYAKENKQLQPGSIETIVAYGGW